MKLVTIILLTGLIILGLNLNGPILIKSFESKTKEGKDIYNKISFEWTPKKDYWLMNQSHFGINADKSKWDRLLIIVDKETNPKMAKFYQLKNGDLKYSKDILTNEVPYRVSCYFCHSNGPRLIRPDANFKLSLKENLTLMKFNLIIKSYGRIESIGSDRKDLHAKMPFKWEGKDFNQVINSKTCLICHNSENTFLRNKLTKQQGITIKFLIKHNLMPPYGIKLPLKEKEELLRKLNF